MTDTPTPAPVDLTPEVLARIALVKEVRSGNFEDRDWMIDVIDRLVAAIEGEHGADWSDWDIDHPEEPPSCKCGYNGTPEECTTSRFPALLSGVRSRDARIVELEEKSRALKMTGENWFHKCMEARTEREALKAALAAREAVLAEALKVLKQHGTRGGWQLAGGEAKRILESGATNG